MNGPDGTMPGSGSAPRASSQTGPAGARSEPPGSAPHQVQVLVVGTDDWPIERAAAEIEAGSISVVRCHEPGQPPFPCNALIEGRVCPLDAGFDVVADVRSRPTGSLTNSETGVVCALYHGRPLVVAGVAPEVPLGPWATVTVSHGGSLVDACRRAATEGQLAAGSKRQIASAQRR